DCFFCQLGQGNLCSGSDAALASGGLLDGTTRLTSAGAPLFQMAASGTFQEHTIIPASGAVKIPDDVDMKVAALIGCGVLTGVGPTIEQTIAMTRRGGQSILVGVPRMDVMLTLPAFLGVVLQEKTIKGCWYGSSNVQDDVPKLVDLYKKGELKLDELISREIN